jgi:putative glutamine amidotransferase
VQPGSRLDAAFRERSIEVNSMHHQAVKTLAESLVPSGRAPDGLIEAFESGTDHFLVGVQWHPEVFERSDLGTKSLFRQFIAAAARD